MKRAWPLPVLLLLLSLALWLRPRSSPSRPSLEPAPNPRKLSAEDVEPRRALGRSPATEDSPAPAAAGAPSHVALAPLIWLEKNQNLDGTWGDGPGTVDGVLVGAPGLGGLALLAYLGAGYSHLSKDDYGGRSMGDVVGNGLNALLSDLREDGSFRSARGSLDQAIGALALAEAYGLSGSARYRDPAQAAIRALAALQAQDGSWGDPTTTAWAADAFKSAEISGLERPAGVYDAYGTYVERRGGADARELLARIQLDRSYAHPSVATAAARIAAAPPHADSPLHELYLDSRALFHADGPRGELWTRWNEPFKASLISRQGRDGAWAGAGLSDTVVRTSLATLALEVYYRYASQ